MKYQKIGRAVIYIAIFSIAFVLFALATALDMSDVSRVVMATPGVTILVAALYQLLRDNLAHERDLILRRRVEIFDAGFASHMAEVVFDKHVEFCEEYVKAASDILAELWKNGPRGEAIDAASDLFTIRRKYILWVTADITNQLGKFESVLRGIGINSKFLEDTPVGEKRSKIVKEMFDAFQDLIGVIKHGAGRDNVEISVLQVIAWLQGVLGIAELTGLRKKILQDAAK